MIKRHREWLWVLNQQKKRRTGMKMVKITLLAATALTALSGLAIGAGGSGILEANGGNISHTGISHGSVVSPGWHSGESGSARGSGAGGSGDNDSAGSGSGRSGAGTGSYTDGNKGAGSDKAMSSYSCQRKPDAKGLLGIPKGK
jgi:hypothetical protein